MKQCTYFKQTMKDDLMRVYREVVSTCDCKTQKDAYRMTVEHRAPRFYVDARWAHQRISPMMRGDRSELEKMSPLARAQYEALFDIVLRMSQEEKFWGRRLYYIVQQAVQQPAPRFYISAKRMEQIWFECRRHKKKRVCHE